MDDELRETLRRMDDQLRRGVVEFEANRLERSEMREFMREMNIRYERSFQAVVEELKDGRDQLRANTAATWAMVDLLRGTR
jgi:hypothetical protein